MTCDYQGRDFGAPYPDSTCIEGFLWDLDSCDVPGGPLAHGGELACPRCNTRRFLDDAREDAEAQVSGEIMGVPWCSAVAWEGALRKAHREAPERTAMWLANAAPFVTCDWPDRQAVYDRRAQWADTVERQWPWPFSLEQPGDR